MRAGDPAPSPTSLTNDITPGATTLDPGGTAGGERTQRQERRELAGALLRSKTVLIGATISLWWVIDAALWPAIAPYDPQALDLLSRLQGPSGAHLLGTDDLGRDVLSRVLAGASSVLTVAPAATALGLLGGVAIGLVTGYYRGIVDETLMRLVDAVLAFPMLVIAALVLAALGSSKLTVIVVIGILFVPLITRTTRSAVLAERDQEYVHAAKLRGESGLRIMVAEILPNVTGPLTVEATVRFGYAIFTAATLSFLSLGLQQPSPDWGLTISVGRLYVQAAPWMVLSPAIALGTLVVAINLLADGVKQVVEQ